MTRTQSQTTEQNWTHTEKAKDSTVRRAQTQMTNTHRGLWQNKVRECDSKLQTTPVIGPYIELYTHTRILQQISVFSQAQHSLQYMYSHGLANISFRHKAAAQRSEQS